MPGVAPEDPDRCMRIPFDCPATPSGPDHAETQEYWFCVLTSGRAWGVLPTQLRRAGTRLRLGCRPPAALASSLGSSRARLPSRPAAACSPGWRGRSSPGWRRSPPSRRQLHTLTPPRPWSGSHDPFGWLPSYTAAQSVHVSLLDVCRCGVEDWTCKQNPTLAFGPPTAVFDRPPPASLPRALPLPSDGSHDRIAHARLTGHEGLGFALGRS
ncbi:uncharacterized protein LOC116569833 isoform X2 [Mustela erminea]|uniref:uncharacterized protein LOC116569833 isoform X2 n=1 Tax=Mustela erminea TaxID=36723 RepID=UPI0013868AE2|nr:uncharacterized protein LOC116569833 isoform X2 [Mustela erminea]